MPSLLDMCDHLNRQVLDQACPVAKSLLTNAQLRQRMLIMGRQGKHVAIDLHAEVNSLKMTREKKTFKQLTVSYLSSFDVIMGADICFWDQMADELFKLIKRSEKAGVRQVLIADPCRPPFSALASRCQDRLSKVEVLEKFLKRPVNASGEILIVNNK